MSYFFKNLKNKLNLYVLIVQIVSRSFLVVVVSILNYSSYFLIAATCATRPYMHKHRRILLQRRLVLTLVLY
jgi:hypothetical protein